MLRVSFDDCVAPGLTLNQYFGKNAPDSLVLTCPPNKEVRMTKYSLAIVKTLGDLRREMHKVVNFDYSEETIHLVAVPRLPKFGIAFHSLDGIIMTKVFESPTTAKLPSLPDMNDWCHEQCPHISIKDNLVDIYDVLSTEIADGTGDKLLVLHERLNLSFATTVKNAIVPPILVIYGALGLYLSTACLIWIFTGMILGFKYLYVRGCPASFYVALFPVALALFEVMSRNCMSVEVEKLVEKGKRARLLTAIKNMSLESPIRAELICIKHHYDGPKVMKALLK